MRPIDPVFHAALYALWAVSRQYRDAVDRLDELHDRGHPDGTWELAKSLARADLSAAYREFCAALDRIVPPTDEDYP